MLKFLNSGHTGDDMQMPIAKLKSGAAALGKEAPNFDAFDYSQLMLRENFSEKANSEVFHDFPVLGDGSFKLKLIAEGSSLGIRNVTFSYGYYQYEQSENQPTWISICQEKVSNTGGFFFEQEIDTLKEKVELFDNAHTLDVLNTSFYFRILVVCSEKSSFDIEIWQKETISMNENIFKNQSGKRCLNYRFLGYGEDELHFDDGCYVSTRFLDTTFELNLEPGSYCCVVKKNDMNISIGNDVDFSIWCSVHLNGVDYAYCDNIASLWCSKPFLVHSKKMYSLNIQAGQSQNNYVIEGSNYDIFFLKNSSGEYNSVFLSEDSISKGVIHFVKVMHDAYIQHDYKYANKVFNFFPSDKSIHPIKSKLESLYLEPLRRFEQLKNNVDRAFEVKDIEDVRRQLERESGYKDCIVEGLIYARSKLQELVSEKQLIDQIMKLLKKHGEEVDTMTITTASLGDSTFISLEKTRQREKKEKIVSTMLSNSKLFNRSSVCISLNIWFNVVESFFSVLGNSRSNELISLFDSIEKEQSFELLENGSFKKWYKMLDIIYKDQMSLNLDRYTEKLKQANNDLTQIHQDLQLLTTDLQAKFESKQNVDNLISKKLDATQKKRIVKRKEITDMEFFLNANLFLYLDKSHKEFGIDVFNWIIPTISKHIQNYVKTGKAFCQHYEQKHQPNITKFVTSRNMSGLLEYLEDNKFELLEKDLEIYRLIHKELSSSTPNFLSLASQFTDEQKKAFSKEIIQAQRADKSKDQGGKHSPLLAGGNSSAVSTANATATAAEEEEEEEYEEEEELDLELQWEGSEDIEPLYDYESIPYDQILGSIRGEMKEINGMVNLKDESMRDESTEDSHIGQLMRKRLIPSIMSLFLEDLKPEYNLWSFIEKLSKSDTELSKIVTAINTHFRKRTSRLSSFAPEKIPRMKFRYFLSTYIINAHNLTALPKIVTSPTLSETHKPTYLLHNKNNQIEFIKYLNFFKTFPIKLRCEIAYLEYDPKYEVESP